jgi:uncharacterized membrane protein YgcG
VAGTSIALVMCGVSFALLGWARRGSGQALLAAMLGSVLASFVIIAVAIVLLNFVWPELLRGGAITAIVVYMAYRFAEALQGSGSSGSGSSGSGSSGSGSSGSGSSGSGSSGSGSSGEHGPGSRTGGVLAAVAVWPHGFVAHEFFLSQSA